MDSKGRRQALKSVSVTLMHLTLLPVEAEEGKAVFRKCLPSPRNPEPSTSDLFGVISVWLRAGFGLASFSFISRGVLR